MSRTFRQEVKEVQTERPLLQCVLLIYNRHTECIAFVLACVGDLGNAFPLQYLQHSLDAIKVQMPILQIFKLGLSGQKSLQRPQSGKWHAINTPLLTIKTFPDRRFLTRNQPNIYRVVLTHRYWPNSFGNSQESHLQRRADGCPTPDSATTSQGLCSCSTGHL